MPTLTQAIPVLTAVDVEAAATFWRELGFDGRVVADGFATLRRDDIELFVSSVTDQVVPDNTMAWLRVRGLDELHADWSRRLPIDRTVDGTVITPVADQPWGREFVVIDAAGNCVHLTEVA